MDPISEFNTLVDALWTTWAAIVDQVRLFALPGWRQYQLGIIVLLIACAWGLRKIIAPRFEAWSRTREGWPKWRLRILVQIRKRIGLLIFCLLSWAVYLVMQELTWPSRSYMIGLGATIASVWLAVGFLTRLVRNPTLRRILAWTLWICGTLFALGLFDEVSAFLDGLVIGIGEFKVSVLTILQAAVIVIILLIAARFATQQAATTIRKNEDISPLDAGAGGQGCAASRLRHRLHACDPGAGLRPDGDWPCFRGPSASASVSACRRWCRT